MKQAKYGGIVSISLPPPTVEFVPDGAMDVEADSAEKECECVEFAVSV